MLVLLLLCLSAKAGMGGLTFHSRANCAGFNESISWDFGKAPQLQTYSQHFKNMKDIKPTHTLDTGAEDTWRSAAYHMTEGYGGWKVIGWHYLWNGQSWTLMTKTQVTNCSIYDGWWGH